MAKFSQSLNSLAPDVHKKFFFRIYMFFLKILTEENVLKASNCAESHRKSVTLFCISPVLCRYQTLGQKKSRRKQGSKKLSVPV